MVLYEKFQCITSFLRDSITSWLYLLFSTTCSSETIFLEEILNVLQKFERNKDVPVAKIRFMGNCIEKQQLSEFVFKTTGCQIYFLIIEHNLKRANTV